MTVEYFIIMTVLSLCYLFVRYVFLSVWQLPPAPRETIQPDGHPIDTRQLTNRLQHVREELAEIKSPAQSTAFKRALLVQSKREQLVKLNFFQIPQPTPPEPESEHGAFLLLV